jgi:hypothetical protein
VGVGGLVLVRRWSEPSAPAVSGGTASLPYRALSVGPSMAREAFIQAVPGPSAANVFSGTDVCPFALRDPRRQELARGVGVAAVMRGVQESRLGDHPSRLDQRVDRAGCAGARRSGILATPAGVRLAVLPPRFAPKRVL